MEYSGEKNLNVMKLAENYNNFLIDLIIKSIKTSLTAKQIMDFGAGDGFFATAVSSRLNQKVISLEPAENMEKYYTEKPLKSLADITDSSLDFIYSLNVLEHIEDDVAIVKEFHRVLKSGGTILLYLPAFPILYSSMDKLVGHYRRYVKEDVKRLFNDKNWSVEKVEYADFLGWFMSLLFKYIGNKSGEISSRSLKIYDKFIFPLSRLCDKLTLGKICGKNIIIRITKI